MDEREKAEIEYQVLSTIWEELNSPEYRNSEEHVTDWSGAFVGTQCLLARMIKERLEITRS